MASGLASPITHLTIRPPQPPPHQGRTPTTGETTAPKPKQPIPFPPRKR